MSDGGRKHTSKHKRSHESGEQERSKSKKHHKSRHDETSNHKERKKQGVPRIVDDDMVDDDMWIENNIDMNGDRVCYITGTIPATTLILRTQPLASDIPTAEALKLTSRAATIPDDPPLPRAVVTESTLQREEWMLEPPSLHVVSGSTSRKRTLVPEDESLTEGYGESSHDARAATGGVDFFSSLGTARQKKPKMDPTEAGVNSSSCNP